MIVGVGLLRIDGEDPPILVDRGAHLALGVPHDAERESRIGTIRLAPHHRVELGARRRPLLAGNVDTGQRQARGGIVWLAPQGRPQLLDRAVEVTQLPERHSQADARVDQLLVQPIGLHAARSQRRPGPAGQAGRGRARARPDPGSRGAWVGLTPVQGLVRQAWSRPGRQARESHRRRAQPPPDRADNAPFTRQSNLHGGPEMAPKPPRSAPRRSRGASRAWPPKPPRSAPRRSRGASRAWPPNPHAPRPGGAVALRERAWDPRHGPKPPALRATGQCSVERTSCVAEVRSARRAVPCGHAHSTTTAGRRDRAGVYGARARCGRRFRDGDHGLQESDLRLLCGVGGSPAHERLRGAGRGRGRSGADQGASRRAA